MLPFLFHRSSTPVRRQYLFSISLVMFVSGVCFLFSGFLGYRVVALLLLATVSFAAMFFDIFPVLLAALLSALSWDFFFIPPRFTFQVKAPEDALMLLMYFLIALVNAALTYKVRQMEKRMRKEEEKASMLRLYDTILNSLSHELRTPIAAIMGAADNLQSDASSLSPQDKENLLAEISVASERLNRQVENLLNMSRLESGMIRPRPDWCDLNELVYSAVNSLEPYTRGHRLKIGLKEKLPLVRLDFGLMEQALSNLVLNAATHTPPGTTIRIGVECADVCTITVSDNGPGFPEAEAGRIFEKFYRLRNTRPGGTGLGLSIVKGFIEANGGTVRLERNEPQGAAFVITLPVEMSYVNNLKHE